MGMLFRNWLEEGFYEDDGSGDLTKLTDPKEIADAAKRGKLYEHDGTGMSLWRQNEANKLLDEEDDNYSGIMSRHFSGDDDTNNDDDYGSIIKHFKD